MVSHIPKLRRKEQIKYVTTVNKSFEERGAKTFLLVGPSFPYLIKQICSCPAGKLNTGHTCERKVMDEVLESNMSTNKEVIK